jgi:hypothetical protein
MPRRSSNRSFRTRASQKGQSKSKSKSQKGGNQGAYPDSAWGFQLNNVGDAWSQFTRVMGSPNTSNVITPASTATTGATGASHAPVAPAHASQMGGKRRNRSRAKKGGYWGAVLEQAAVPLTLLGLQQKFGTRRNQGAHRNKTFRRRH